MKTNIHLFDVSVISGTQRYELHSTITSTLHKTNIYLFDVSVISGTQRYELHSTITSTLHEDQYIFI